MSRATDIDATIGRNLRVLRALHDMSQDDLAGRMTQRGHLTWSRATVSEVERGHRAILVSEAAVLADIFLLKSAARLWSGPLVVG